MSGYRAELLPSGYRRERAPAPCGWAGARVPEHDHAVFASRREHRLVRRECHRMHFITVTAQRFGALPPCARIPQTHGLVAAADARSRPSRENSRRQIQAPCPSKGGNPLAGIAIPHLRHRGYRSRFR